MLIDSHAHLNVAAFYKDREEVVKRCLDNDIWTINVGTNLITSKKAVELAGNYEKGVYAAVGLHPISLDTGLIKKHFDRMEGGSYETEFDYQAYKKLAQSKNVVAIGEIGLDFYWKPKTTGKKELFKQMQRDLLAKQLELAKELNLPVIFHCRVAHKDLLDFVGKNSDLMPKKYIAHGFVGNLEELQKYLSLGFYIGINGIIFKTIEGINFEENIKNIPLEKLLLETDCPYLTPHQADAERNEPIFMKYIAEEIAKIKNLELERVIESSTKNIREIFKI
jgi:TatD DNase family protein